MAKISRYDGNLVSFASGASSGKRTVFGDTTESDTLDDNINADFLVGWEIVGDTPPTKQDFNAVAFTTTRVLSYIHQMGVPEWNTNQEYYLGSATIRSGELYVSKVTPNTGNDPATDSVSWKRLAGYEEVESADLISYDNAASGLSSTDVQGAIDELRNANKVLYDNSTSGLATTTVQGAIDLVRESVNVRYDNTTSGLTATNVKAALDELSSAENISYDNATTGLTATDTQAAIDETFNTLLPTGVVSYFAQDTAPTGWLKADGSAVSRATYSNLYTAIGTVFGAGDGSTTFNLPDLRGEFIRGWDDGRGVDSGRIFGSDQDDALEQHSHYSGVSTSGGGEQAAYNGSGKAPTSEISASRRATGVNAGPPTTTGITTGVISTGAAITDGKLGATTSANPAQAETRPRNIALNACIKT